MAMRANHGAEASDALCALVAKTDPADERLWLPLTIHLHDTAAVMEYLVTNWLPERYAESLGLTREKLLRLAKAAALLHDLGKAICLFQEMITERRPELRQRLGAAGLPIEPRRRPEDERVPHAVAGAELLRLAGKGESLAAIVGAHHGKPETWMSMPYWKLRPKSFGWDENGGRDTAWGAVQRELLDWAAAQIGSEALPECSEPAQMALTGLVIMADWIASNTAYFPLIRADELPRTYDPGRAARALRALHLPQPWRVSDDWRSADYFLRRFGFAANSLQTAAETIAADMESPGVMILEAPMGQGKTEAALAAAEVLMNRFSLGGAAFFLPSQATSNAMYTRLTQWAGHQPDAVRVAVELAHGQAEFNEEFAALEEGSVQVGAGEPDDETLIVHSFFRGRKTKLLANLVVGTVDQLLMAGLKQKHVMLRHLGLTGKVVILDECHAYDAYMNVYLDRILNWLGAYHVPVILLSATLPGARRAELLRAYLGERKTAGAETAHTKDYPLISWTEGKAVRMQPVTAGGRSRSVNIQRATEEQAIEAAGRALERGCVGIIVNTVRRAQALRERLRAAYPEAEILLDHSRFLTPDRLAHERAILERVGKTSTADLRRGVLVIGTQVLEQSLDLDFDLLITELCPMDLLLQRIGRLQRHDRPRPDGLDAARCLVLGAEGEPDAGSRAVYGDYLLLRTRALLPDVIRLPEDISPLVQKAYDPTDCPPKEDAAWEQYDLVQKNQQQRARGFLLRKPSREASGETIEGLLDSAPGFTDQQARAAVRDGDAAIEVLIVQQTEDGRLRLRSAAKKDAVFRADSQPSAAEARRIAEERLRLPAYFSRRYCANDVICELEAQTRRVPLWTQAPMLAGELFLILDPDGTAELAGKRLRYDPAIGLIDEEVHDEGN